MEQINDRKRSINNRITETLNKNSKTSEIGLTTKNQYLVVSTTTGFINAKQSNNDVKMFSVIGGERRC